MAKLSRDHSEIILMFIWKKETFIQQVAKYTLNCSKIHLYVTKDLNKMLFIILFIHQLYKSFISAFKNSLHHKR